MVFFESPHRTAATLAAMTEAFGADRRGAVCRELTKTYEEVVRGPLSELASWAEGQEHGVRGEVTLVIAGAESFQRELTPDELRDLVVEAEGDGLSRKDAIARVAAETGVRRQDVYAAAHTS
jgi:16S rRNA (cytidine1402-2'-O)-methyltransferase